ncbi:MAG: hypothetical protein E6J90_43295 [Deltaproteobacteria bacterium]|nr:MAG: hypothetical protein E6J90_43295 [Deltaproteobacteria bacterium]TMQ19548.1 MAG: hypothetical protein E6J91_06025 [Deltaproteobacteria bacterium]
MSERFELGAPTQPSEHAELLALVRQSLGFPADRAQDWLRQLGPEHVRIARAGTRVARRPPPDPPPARRSPIDGRSRDRLASRSDPLLLLLPGEEPRRIADHLRWMVRVLDVPAALETRGYSACVRGEVALDVRDDVVPENQATFVVSVEHGRASVHRARSVPRAVAIDGDDDDLARLTSLFTGPARWMPEIF